VLRYLPDRPDYILPLLQMLPMLYLISQQQQQQLQRQHLPCLLHQPVLLLQLARGRQKEMPLGGKTR
jgi:hypothetical protein